MSTAIDHIIRAVAERLMKTLPGDDYLKDLTWKQAPSREEPTRPPAANAAFDTFNAFWDALPKMYMSAWSLRGLARRAWSAAYAAGERRQRKLIEEDEDRADRRATLAGRITPQVSVNGVWRPSWALNGKFMRGDADDLVPVTRETLRIALSTIRRAQKEDHNHLLGAAAHEILSALDAKGN